MKIFLDDIRNPPDDTWVVVRSYDEFVDLITNSDDLITEISFDHDLGLDKDNNIAKTGMDATKFFIEMCMDDPIAGLSLEKVNIHSSNPPGRDNIASYFKSARDNNILSPKILITK